MNGVLIGIKYHPARTFVYFFASFSVLWTLVEGLTYFIPALDLRKPAALAGVAAVGLFYAAVMIRRPTKIKMDIRHTNTKLVIRFGDIFEEEGFRAIGVNEFFDSELGLPVSPKSLHGLLLTTCFGGHGQTFDRIIEQELAGAKSETVARKQGKCRRYEIGTTAVVPVNDDRYLCFAMTKTDVETCKAYADIPMLWQALRGMQEKARVSLGGLPLVIPLAGGGLSGIGLPAKELLDFIILSVITETQRRQVGTHITIVLGSDRFENIDLREAKRHWS